MIIDSNPELANYLLGLIAFASFSVGFAIWYVWPESKQPNPTKVE